MKKILCFGELLLRYSPTASGDWLDKQSMPVFVGGAELNVARSLSLWGAPVAYLTQLPDNYLSQHIINFLSKEKVDMNRIVLEGTKLGTYYLKQSSDLKNRSTIYDRKGSSFCCLKTGTLDWNRIFENVGWFHFSAIVPALNASVSSVCAEAIAVANEKNITVSVDLNYRESLWDWGVQPADIMPALVEGCDVVMGNIWSIKKMLGIGTPEKFDETKASAMAQAKTASIEITKRFPRCGIVANTFRMDISERTEYYATLFANGELFSTDTYTTTSTKDRGGLIALDKDGNIAMPFNTSGMFRAAVTDKGETEILVF